MVCGNRGFGATVVWLRTAVLLGGILAVAGLAGCSDLGSTGSEVRVFVQNSGEGPGGGGPVADGWTGAAQAGFAGDLRVRVTALVQDDVGFWTNVTSSSQELVLPIGGEDAGTVQLGSRALAAGTYSRVRLIFTLVEAQLTEAPPGFPMPADGRVEVERASDGRIVVSKNATLLLNGEDDIDVTFDLRSGVWLPGTDEGVVGTLIFSSAVTVEVE